MTANRQKEHQSFKTFWPFYLQEHAKPATRNLHYVGTSLVVLIAFYSSSSQPTGRYCWQCRWQAISSHGLPIGGSRKTGRRHSLIRSGL